MVATPGFDPGFRKNIVGSSPTSSAFNSRPAEPVLGLRSLAKNVRLIYGGLETNSPSYSGYCTTLRTLKHRFDSCRWVWGVV